DAILRAYAQCPQSRNSAPDFRPGLTVGPATIPLDQKELVRALLGPGPKQGGQTRVMRAGEGVEQVGWRLTHAPDSPLRRRSAKSFERPLNTGLRFSANARGPSS